MAEYGLATISVLTPHHRLRPRAADLPRSWNTTQPSPISATHIGKRLAGKLHEPFERAGGGRAKTPPLPTLHRGSLEQSRPRLGGGECGGKAAGRGKGELATHGPDSELDIPCHTRHGPAGSTTQIVKLSRLTFDKSPLRESRTVGSVGEVPGNWHLYPTKSLTVKVQRTTLAPSHASVSARMLAKR